MNISVVTCILNTPRLPKRLAHSRRNIESKRIENFKKIHEEMKCLAKEERESLRDFFKTSYDDDDNAEEDNKRE